MTDATQDEILGEISHDPPLPLWDLLQDSLKQVYVPFAKGTIGGLSALNDLTQRKAIQLWSQYRQRLLLPPMKLAKVNGLKTL